MLNIKKTIENEIATIQVEGRLDAVTASDLEAVLMESIPGATALTLDLAGLEYISSAGLRVLLSAHKTMSDQDKKMTVINVNDAIMKIFDITGFSEILTIG